MDVEPTIIIKSLKDLNQFLYSNMEARIPEEIQQTSNMSNISRLKLSFSDSVCSVDSVDGSSINLKLADSVAFNYDESCMEPTFIEKHQNDITGFDVCKKLRDKDKEVIEGRTKISLLEFKAGNFEVLNKKVSILHEKEIAILRTKSIEDNELISLQKRQIKQMQEAEINMKEEVSNLKMISDEEIYEKAKKLHDSQEEHNKEQNTILEDKGNLQKMVSKLQNELLEANCKVSLQEEHKSDLEDQLKKMSSSFSSIEILKHEIETLKFQLSKSELNNKELNIRLEALESTDSMQQLLDKSLIRLSSLEKEILKLKEENDTYRISILNIDLMEEKLSSSEKEVEVLRNRCKNFTEENATLITLRNLSEQSELVIREQLKLQYSPSPIELKSILADLCSCDSDLKNSVDELKASVKSHESFRESQEALLTQFRTELQEKQDKLTKDAQLIRRLQRKLLMVSKERDGLKDIISSYESESTLSISALEKTRILSLEAQLTAYKQELSRLEVECGLTVSSHSSSPQKESGNKADENILGLGKKVVALEELVEILKDEKEALELRIETELPHSTFNPMTTKVVEFVNNPLATAHNEKKELLEKLQKENEALKCRLKLIDEGEQLNLTQKVGANVETSKQIKELKEKIESAELRNKRVMEVYKKTSYDLREVIHRLIGYRIDIVTDGKYKLINTYSESQEDFLLFQQASNGDLQMLQTDFSCTLEDLMEEYLEQLNSYPGFLSAVTISLMNKSNIEEIPSDEDEEQPSDDPLSDCDEQQSDAEEQHSDANDKPSDCDDQQSDLADEQSIIDDQQSDDQAGDCEEETSEEEEEEEEEEEMPSKRMKMDEDDDDDLIICLD